MTADDHRASMANWNDDELRRISGPTAAHVVLQDASKVRTLIALLPIMLVVFVGYLIIGIPLPVLPVHVHRDLGLSTVIVGIVAGSQFAASVLSRIWAGHLADSRGANSAVVAGLLLGIASGVRYLVSTRCSWPARYWCWSLNRSRLG